MSAHLDINQFKEKFEVVWQPIPASSQELAIDSRCDHTLYEGARGPGKTITQLMKFARNVGKGYGAYWKGVIFDREFDNLKGLVTESKKWFKKVFGDDCEFMESTQSYKWVWKTGEELLFRHVKKPGDYDGFHGHEYPFIGWNELTKYPTSALYDKFMSVNRCTFMPERDTPKDEKGRYLTEDGKPLPPIKLQVFSTTNPNGPGHNWVKRRFIDVAPRGTVVRVHVEVFDPQTQENTIVVRTQVAIFGSYRENIYLTKEYVAELESITDDNLRRAWLFGDWDIVTGGAFDDVWDRRKHVLPRFVIPDGWRVDRAFDWGSSHPFSVGWFAESDGTEALIPYEGKVFSFCPPRGTLVQIFEWYGCKRDKQGQMEFENKGIKLGSGAIAKGIVEREISLLANGWISKKPYPGPADNQIGSVTDTEKDTTAKTMADNGIEWTTSDKASGARAIGMQIVRDKLEAVKKNEGPGLYFMSNCIASISTIPTLPRDEDKLDDVDTDAEDHCYDMVRYRCLVGADKAAVKLKMQMPH